MGKPVVNDVVKLTDWDSSGWLQKGGKKPGSRVVFVFASKVYKTDEGKDLTVFFIPSTAYVWDEDDPWNAEEMRRGSRRKATMILMHILLITMSVLTCLTTITRSVRMFWSGSVLPSTRMTSSHIWTTSHPTVRKLRHPCKCRLNMFERLLA